MIQSYEVVVFLRTLKNVFLERKGTFNLKLMLQITCDDPPSVYDISQPYMLFKSNKKQQREYVSGNPSILNKTFISEQMEMKFIDQQISLSDVIGYRVDLTKGCCVTLICQLSKQVVIESKKIISSYEAKVKVRSIKQGVSEYIEIPFQQNQEISLNLCLFSVFAGLKTQSDSLDQKPNQFNRNYLKEMRYHSFNSQQNLLKLFPPGFFKQENHKGKQYFFLETLLGREQFQNLIYQLCCDNFVFLKKVLETLQQGHYTIEDLKKKHIEQRKDKYTDFVFNRKQNYWTNQGRIKLSKKIRKSSNYLSISKKILPIQIEGEFSKIKYQPVAFHQVQLLIPLKKHQIPKINKNLYILCHGFQGTVKDLILLRNIIKHFNPEGYYLIASSYQNQFQLSSILEMGQKLSRQIQQFMKQQNLLPNHTKIHFVCFSLGGVIARASFPHLSKLYFGRYTSISTPHLGLPISDTLATIGLFMLKNILKYKCIKQLCFSDSKQIEKSAMYRLSEEGSLNKFQQVVIISNSKDTFVPWESARIQSIGGKIKDVEDVMISNIINNLYTGKVHRLDFDSNEPKSSICQTKQKLEEMIGRATHMQFIKNDVMIRMMLNTVGL